MGEVEWSQGLLLTRNGRPPDPARLAAFAALGTMTDALLHLMEPYVWWPPAPDEIEELEGWLKLGAAVWNATVEATSSEALRENLREIVIAGLRWDEDDPVTLVDEIALRKLRQLGHDDRSITSVRVWTEAGQAFVEAATMTYLR